MNAHRQRASTNPVPASSSWETFLLARGKVMRALQALEDEAAEWLRRAALDKTVRVRFSADYLLRSKTNPGRESARLNDPSMIEGDGEDNGVCACEWWLPNDELNVGLQAMAEPGIRYHTEWHAADLQAALEKAAPVSTKSRKGIGGRPPHSFWHVLGVEAGAWMADEGAPSSPGELVRFIGERLALHGFEADKSLIQNWAQKFLDAYHGYRAGGN
jgi:hypothetical protein